jgi:hypothetical protein
MARGRALIKGTPLSAFVTGVDGNLPINPVDGELAYDDSREDFPLGIVVVPAGDPSAWEFISSGKETAEHLESLDYSGVFENAQAASLGRDLTFFIFDTQNESIILNPALRYPEQYRYFAIRSGSDYITGHVNSLGNVIANTADMEQLPAEYGAGTVRKPQMAHILPGAEIVDGDVYIVEFFDATKHLIDRDSFYAETATIMQGDLMDDVALSSIHIVSTRPVSGEEDACFLYEGESVDQLDFRVLIQFIDGTRRDVTHELSATGRLQVTGLDAIDRNEITWETMNAATFNIKYFSITNAGGVGTSSIDKDIKLYIKQDPAANIRKVMPIYWLPLPDASIVMHTLFGIYDNGNLVNIDNRLAPAVGLETAPGDLAATLDNTVTVTANVRVGLGNETVAFAHDVTFSDDPVDVGFLRYGAVDMLNNESNIYRHLQYNKTLGDHPVEFIGDGYDTSAEIVTDNSFTDDDAIVHTPTHFRIRNLEGNHYYVGGVGLPITDFGNFNVIENGADGTLTEDKPVIIEFINRVDGGGGNYVVNEVTNARPAYVKIIN